MTLWDFRKFLGVHLSRVYNSDGTYVQETPCHPASIRIYRYAGCTDLKEADNGKTLAELRFKGNEQLTAFKRNVFNSVKVPLVNPEGNDMSDRCYDIFRSWFETFSEEEIENPGKRVMTRQTLANFIKSCTDDICLEDDLRVTGFFTMYDGD